MLNRRRAMMAAQSGGGESWEDVTPSLNDFIAATSTGCQKTYDSSANTLRVYCTSKKTYCGGHIPYTLTTGYKYRVSYHVAIVSGTHRTAFAQNNTSSLLSPHSGNQTASTDIDYVYEYTGTPSVGAFRILCTMATSEIGDCTISNFKIERAVL